MIRFTIITLFPEAIRPYLETSMMWKATEKGLVEFEFVNLRDYGLGPHKSVDDTPYGGGDGMLLRCEPVFAAIESAKASRPDAKVILPTPVGEIWCQEKAREFAGVFYAPQAVRSEETLAGCCPTAVGVERTMNSLFVPRRRPVDDPKGRERRGPGPVKTGARAPGSEERQPETPTISSANPESSRDYIILCPHYEGYDERILSIVDYPISLGKYVLTGGELAALIIIDSVVRLVPGVLGGESSAIIESFSDGDNLEYPQYTKPYDFRGMKVPDILLSGNHGEIAKWRAEHSGRANSE